MFSKVQPILLHSLSSVHAGSGSEVGIVDLPIQREKHTGYPKIESSSLKGAIRMTVTDLANVQENEVEKEDRHRKISYSFGASYEQSKTKVQTSALGFADARILFFPVKSLRGVFAWVTSPYVLNRFANELKQYGSKILDGLTIPQTAGAASDKLYVRNTQIVLEEYTFTIEKSEEVRLLAERFKEVLFAGQDTNFGENMVVLEDDDFKDFVHLSTEVNTRIHINPETGTVAEGALWNEENLPPESILYSYIFVSDVRVDEATKAALDFKTAQDVLAFMQNPEVLPSVFQLGGNSTLGRGMLRLIWA